MQNLQMHQFPGAIPEPGSATPEDILSAQDLLAGSAVLHRVDIPPEVLRPASAERGKGIPAEAMAGGWVRLRPLRIATLALISRAAREDGSLVPLLLIKEGLVEPALSLDQIRQMHAGLVHFLVARINQISGLDGNAGGKVDASATPLGETHILLARHFGWTPQQVAELTPGQVAIYLAGIERLAGEPRREGEGQ